MTPFEVLALLTGLVVLAVVLGTAWQKWEDHKLVKSGVPTALEQIRKELMAVRAEVEKTIGA